MFNRENILWMIRRLTSYGFGLFLVAFAVSLSVKSMLGISPAMSVPYVCSLIGEMSMGAFTILINCGFILLQIILKGRAFEKRYLLQVPVSIVFGFIVDFTNILVGYLPDAHNYAAQLVYLFFSLNTMGFGYVFYLTPNIVPLPSEGVMQAISYRFKIKNSTAKLIWDPICVALTITASLVFLGGIYGIREGTIIAAFGNGLSLKLYLKIFGEKVHDRFLFAPKGARQTTTVLS
ncbi:MAG: YczE/YyaS/YitT family protein [Raoultibacter sp.]|jgi:uncharacterized membrane protein YczE